MKDFEFIHIPKCGGTSIRKALGIEKIGHFSVSEIPRKKLDNLFTFSFVRNPYERIASYYRYLKRDDICKVATNKLSFQEWFDLTLVQNIHQYYYKPAFFDPCFNWVTINGEIAVDFIGKLENITEDWSAICEKLNKSVILDKHNSTKPSNEVYTDQMHEVMQDLYSIDFQTWYPNSIR